MTTKKWYVHVSKNMDYVFEVEGSSDKDALDRYYGLSWEEREKALVDESDGGLDVAWQVVEVESF